jgi:hypothetical protein
VTIVSRKPDHRECRPRFSPWRSHNRHDRRDTTRGAAISITSLPSYRSGRSDPGHLLPQGWRLLISPELHPFSVATMVNSISALHTVLITLRRDASSCSQLYSSRSAVMLLPIRHSEFPQTSVLAFSCWTKALIALHRDLPSKPRPSREKQRRTRLLAWLAVDGNKRTCRLEYRSRLEGPRMPVAAKKRAVAQPG